MNGLASSLAHGFPNLSLIKSSLRLLHDALPHEALQYYSQSLPANVLLKPTSEDVLIHVQRLARRVAQFYNITPRLIVVTFNSNLKSPARINLGDEDDFFVELHSSYRDNYCDEVPALLVHEVTHIFVHRLRLRPKSTLEEEILTDTISTYLGAGWTSLNAHTKIVSTEQLFFGTRTTTRESSIGYLTPEEFGYLLARRYRYFGDNSMRYLSRAEARAAYRAGNRALRRELNRPPLAKCGYMNRLLYGWRLSRALKSRDSSHHRFREFRDYGDYRLEMLAEPRIVFECPICGKQLRVPAHKGRMNVICVACRTHLDCRT